MIRAYSACACCASGCNRCLASNRAGASHCGLGGDDDDVMTCINNCAAGGGDGVVGELGRGLPVVGGVEAGAAGLGVFRHSAAAGLSAFMG